MFYSKEFPDRPDIAFLKNHFYREGRISEEQAIFILQKGTELLKKEPNLLEVDAPITGEFHCSLYLCLCLCNMYSSRSLLLISLSRGLRDI